MSAESGKVAEYRRLALAANALVETSVLANTREKHARSAARWTELADLAERASADHLARVSQASKKSVVEDADVPDLAAEPQPATI